MRRRSAAKLILMRLAPRITIGVRFTDISAKVGIPVGHFIQPVEVFGRVGVVSFARNPRRPPSAPKIELAARLRAWPFAIPRDSSMGDFVAVARDQLMPAVWTAFHVASVHVLFSGFRAAVVAQRNRTRRWRGTALSGVVSAFFHSGELVCFGGVALSGRSLSSAFIPRIRAFL